MKKIIIVLTVMCFVNNIVTAQNFTIGLKAGANFSKISGSSFSNEFKISYHAGAFMSLDFNRKIGIQPEILLSQSQGKIISLGNSGFPTSISNLDYQLNYLSIPLLMRYKFSKVIVLNVGPQYSMLLNKGDNVIIKGVNSFKNGDFAMVAGLQFDFKYLRFYGRYNIGLNNVNDISNSDNWKSQQIQTGIGFRF